MTWRLYDIVLLNRRAQLLHRFISNKVSNRVKRDATDSKSDSVTANNGGLPPDHQEPSLSEMQREQGERVFGDLLNPGTSLFATDSRSPKHNHFDRTSKHVVKAKIVVEGTMIIRTQRAMKFPRNVVTRICYAKRLRVTKQPLSLGSRLQKTAAWHQKRVKRHVDLHFGVTNR